MNQGQKTPRIVIIGAGPAGLSAARSLRDQGFHQVIIFEQNKTAGGKAKSIVVEGRVYEMGAVCGAANSRNIVEVMREVGARKGNWISSKGTHNFFNMKKEPIPLFNSFEIPVLMYQSLAKYYLLTRKHSKIFRPGFKDVDKELCKPFHAFCLENGLHLVEKAFSIVCSPFGYGYFEEVPAAYYMKYLSWPTICSIASWLPGSLFGVDGGVGTMWQNMAKQFDVRYEENITGIFRQGVIRVETD
jgi:hypothetical protein